MANKTFNKFLAASIKRTAQNVSPLVRRKQKLQAEIAEREKELESIQIQLDTYEAPIKEATGGYTTEDLVTRIVEDTGKVDKDGKPIKLTKWALKYPETLVPPVEQGAEAPESAETTEGVDGEDTESTDEAPTDSQFEPFDEGTIID